MRRGSNLPAVGTYNQTLVLDLIRRSPDGVSRIELAARTGLSAQTVTNVARRLAAEGLIVQGSPIVSGPGKPRTPLHLNSGARYAVGIHLDPALDTFVVVDMSGAVVAHAQHTPDQSATADGLLADLGRLASDLLDEAGVHRDRVLGIGVAAPGPIDADRGALLQPPLLPAWHNVSLRDALTAVSALPVMVEKDVVAAMIGEMWVDPSPTLGDAIFVYYGAGVGVGLAVDATAVRGRTGNAGDVAHIVVDPKGPMCGCGERGCLGVAIAPDRLIADAGLGCPGTARAPTDLGDLLGQVADRVAAGEPIATAVIDRMASDLARAIVQINNLLDADVVVVGGPMWSRVEAAAGPRVAAALATSPQITTTRATSVTSSRLGTDVAAVGAACLVLDSAFTARPADLMITPR